MRSQSSNTSPSQRSSDQKKSVFDRLGRQIDSGGRPIPSSSHSASAMKRRSSPGLYGPVPEYMAAPPDAEFGRYPRDQAEYGWRYQDERNRMGYPRDGRHIGGHPMGPAGAARMPPPPLHYEMDMGRPSYYPSAHGYHNGQGSQGIHPQAMSPISLQQQQKSSPKYDRHGNLITNYRDRVVGPPMDYSNSLSPPHGFLPPAHMMHPNMPHDLPPDMRGPTSIYPPRRWPDSMNNEAQFHSLPHPSGRIAPPESGRFSPISARKYQHQAEVDMGQRFTRWRERRDVITNLDRETTQSSSRTDSFKSSLQQHETRTIARNEPESPSVNSIKKIRQTTSVKRPDEKHKTENPSNSAQNTPTTPNTSKTEHQDISDGEIIDDDSSDESESCVLNDRDALAGKTGYSESNQQRNGHPLNSFSRENDYQQYYESTKKRRVMEREDYSLDYETISDDEDLDDFMYEKKDADLIGSDGAGLAQDGDIKSKKSSEIELLNALGLDWANLVELANQPKGPNRESNLGGSTLSRFSMVNYLPTLGITLELAGPDLYKEIVRICRV